ncbi:RING-H2 finger protein ATL70-like [Brassica napus]|uniref:RING-H2 finger protein ATL70-like n=1 Tax=Brassica napus TaxID=3708 RepID=UPI000BBEDB5B|nr:RING-H2 finger protein ATL70-like [Brassica napus]
MVMVLAAKYGYFEKHHEILWNATEANFTELTITDFFKSTDAFPLYLLIVMIFYFVLLHYSRRRVLKQKLKPLNKEIGRSLPKGTLSSESCVFVRSCRCVICLEDYVAGDNDMVPVLPLCGHEFHAFCIDKWFRLGSTCPSCRIIPVAHITPV